MIHRGHRGLLGIPPHRVVALFCMAFLVLPEVVFGNGARKTVRVAYQEFNRQMIVDEDNNPVSGYSYDYVQTIATYASWDVEFVPTASFADSVRMLLAGDVDIIYEISYTEDRAKLILYPDEPMGFEYYYLYASRENTSLTPDDYSSLNGKTVGVTHGTMLADLLKEWSAKKNIEFKIVEYEEIPKKEEDLHAGKIDLDLEVSMLAKPSLSAVEKVGSSAYYLVANKGRPDLIEDINFAMDKILNNDLFFFSRLQERYFSDTVLSRNLTTDEKEWLAGHNVLRVGYFDHYLPLSATDEKGRPIGAGIDAVLECIRRLELDDRLDVEFIRYDNQGEGYRAVESGKVDMMLPAYISNSVKKDYGIICGKSLMTFESDFAYLKDHWDRKDKRIGVNKANLMQYYYSKDVYPDSEIVLYDDIKGCLEGLLDGTSGGTLLNSLRAEALLKPDRYRHIRTVRAPTDFQLSIAFAKDNIGLMLLMDRGLTLLDHEFINRASYSYVERIYTLSTIDFLKEHILAALCLSALLTSLGVALVISWIGGRKLAKSYRKATAYSKALEVQRWQESELRQQLEKKQGELENALQMAQNANRAKSLFFATVSHDIRTPLNAILGFSELLRDGCETEEERNEAIDSIMVSGKTLLGLVNDILDLSKLESGKMDIIPAPTDCPQLMRGLMETFIASADKRGLKLRCSVGKMPPLMLDQQRIRQIVFNLVGNALKFTDAGHVELRVSFDRGDDATSGVFRLDVEDTGCGIAEEDRARLASPYTQVGPQTLRNGGTGLGLAICKQLAVAMGGRLEIASTLGVGSTFSVILPDVKVADVPNAAEQVVADDAQTEMPEVGQVAGGRSPRRILIADDSNINMAVLTSLLRHIGDFDIVTAADGRIALDILQAPGTEPFDLVLTDIWMPNLNGEGLLKAIRANPALASLRVIAVTADVKLRGKAAEMGFDDILLKPLNAAMLSDAILDVGGWGG